MCNSTYLESLSIVIKNSSIASFSPFWILFYSSAEPGIFSFPHFSLSCVHTHRSACKNLFLLLPKQSPLNPDSYQFYLTTILTKRPFITMIFKGIFPSSATTVSGLFMTRSFISSSVAPEDTFILPFTFPLI